MDPTTITVAAILGGILLRGKTGEPAELTTEDAEAMALAACEALDGDPLEQTPKGIARAVARAAYPDLSWAPWPLATAQHKRVWAQLLEWSTELVHGAELEGVTPCELLAKGAIPPVPILPIDPSKTEGNGSSGGDGTASTGGGPGGPGGLAESGPGGANLATHPSGQPTPGYAYRIKLGDSSSALIGKAYGIPSGPNRIAPQRGVWNHPANRLRLRPYIHKASESWLEPVGRPDFLPPYELIYFPEDWEAWVP